MLQIVNSYTRPSPGETCTYHRGSLMYDRVKGEDRALINKAAEAAWADYARGYVNLVQRRVGPTVWAYLAIGRARE